MKYALLDWDNTLREGFSLISWMDFLRGKKLIDSLSLSKIENYFNLYSIEKMGYEEFVENICKEYVLAVSGKVVNDFIEQVDAYVNSIELNAIFQFTRPLIDLINRYNIKPIVVSGAPKIFLQHIMKKLSIAEIFAFDPKIENGIYVNSIHKNYGIKKDSIVTKFITLYEANPIFAFGDSKSDFPMLNSAKYPFLITDKNNIDFNSYEVINPNEDYFHILNSIENKIQLSLN
jgi:HAD superfamily phosphoserine phosphatase-like hydrolase